MNQKQPSPNCQLPAIRPPAPRQPLALRTGMAKSKPPLKPGYYLMRLRVQYADRGVRPLARIP
jgi:hypothetical protein